MDGTTGPAAVAIQETARKFALSLAMPVFLQDERLSSVEAEDRLRKEGIRELAIASYIDSEAAAIILHDFIDSGQQRTLIEPS